MADKQPWELMPYEYARLPESTRVPRGSILDVSPVQLTDVVWLAQRDVKQLGELAICLGAPHTGTREVLTERIVTWAGLRVVLAEATIESLQALKSKDLASLLRSVGEYVPSNRYGRGAALINWRDRARQKGQSAIASAKHFVHIRRALRRGDPVPEDVLACYPSLCEEPDRHPLFQVRASEPDQPLLFE